MRGGVYSALTASSHTGRRRRVHQRQLQTIAEVRLLHSVRRKVAGAWALEEEADQQHDNQVDAVDRQHGGGRSGSGASVCAALAITCADDGTQLSVSFSDRCVRVLRPSTWEVLHTLTGHARSVWCLQYRKGQAPQRLLVTASSDGDVRIWNSVDGDLVAKLALGFSVHDVSFHQNVVLACGQKLLQWKCLNGFLQKFPDVLLELPPSHNFRCARLDHSGQRLIVVVDVSLDFSTRLDLLVYKMDDLICRGFFLDPVFTFHDVQTFTPSGFDISSDGRMLAVCSLSREGAGTGFINVISISQGSFGRIVARAEVEEVEYVTAVQWSNTSRHIVLGYGIDHVRVMRAQVRALRDVLQTDEKFSGVVYRCTFAFSGDDLQKVHSQKTFCSKRGINAIHIDSTFVAEASLDGLYGCKLTMAI